MAYVLKAFKGLSMKLHPDRHRDKPSFIQDAFEEKFKKVVNAKIVLTDDQSRRKYDAELLRQRPRQQPGQWDQRQQNFHFEPRGGQRQQNFNFEPRGGQRQQNFHFEPRGGQRQQNFNFEPRGGQSRQRNQGRSFGDWFDRPTGGMKLIDFGKEKDNVTFFFEEEISFDADGTSSTSSGNGWTKLEGSNLPGQFLPARNTRQAVNSNSQAFSIMRLNTTPYSRSFIPAVT
ncbi:uncharacterized protein [Palaemon carinicauda]|uniref:uncharacterized protein n=1 Tax=Palaemon carinicauda TaxID=392227 RepID=UPI0035B636DB